MKAIRPAHLFLILTVLFLVYSFSLYLIPVSARSDIHSAEAAEGKMVWQKYNCQSCHQIYGLGGYLGPDLTNVYSAPGKGDKYISAMLKAGVAQMPSFALSEKEERLLMAFLRQVDQSGSADPRTFRINASGMISNNE